MKISPLLIFPAPVLIRAQNCWAPDGNTVAVLDFKPCIAIAGMDSMCCALNRTVADTVDTCEQNGMCLYQGGYFRAYCTDRTWKSPNCLNVCTASNTSELTSCPDGSWCCGEANTTCCAESQGFKLAATLVPFGTAASTSVASTTTSSTSSSSKTSSTSSSTTGASPMTPVTTTVTPERTTTLVESGSTLVCSAGDTSGSTAASLPVSASKSDDATKYGVGIGVPLGILAIVGSMLGFWLGQRRGMRRIAGEKEHVDLTNMNGDAPKWVYAGPPVPPVYQHTAPGTPGMPYTDNTQRYGLAHEAPSRHDAVEIGH